MSENEMTVSVERRELVYCNGGGTAMLLTSPHWRPNEMNYLDRATLAAQLRAIAEVVDPGTYEEHLERHRVWSGAEAVTRA